MTTPQQPAVGGYTPQRLWSVLMRCCLDTLSGMEDLLHEGVTPPPGDRETMDMITRRALNIYQRLKPNGPTKKHPERRDGT